MDQTNSQLEIIKEHNPFNWTVCSVLVNYMDQCMIWLLLNTCKYLQQWIGNPTIICGDITMKILRSYAIQKQYPSILFYTTPNPGPREFMHAALAGSVDIMRYLYDNGYSYCMIDPNELCPEATAYMTNLIMFINFTNPSQEIITTSVNLANKLISKQVVVPSIESMRQCRAAWNINLSYKTAVYGTADVFEFLLNECCPMHPNILRAAKINKSAAILELLTEHYSITDELIEPPISGPCMKYIYELGYEITDKWIIVAIKSKISISRIHKFINILYSDAKPIPLKILLVAVKYMPDILKLLNMNDLSLDEKITLVKKATRCQSKLLPQFRRWYWDDKIYKWAIKADNATSLQYAFEEHCPIAPVEITSLRQMCIAYNLLIKKYTDYARKHGAVRCMTVLDMRSLE